MIKTVIVSLCLFVFTSSFVSVVLSANVSIISSSEALIDTTAVREDDNFSTPRQIIIAPIFANEEISELTSEQRYRGIYNYTVEYLGFSDIPYHYLIDKTGTVYQGNQAGDERKVKIGGIGDELVLIGYMTDRTSNRFNYRAEENLVNLLTQVANQNNISPDLISVENVVFIRDEQSKTVNIGTSDLFGNWKSSLAEIKQNVENNFAPTEKIYNVNVESVTASKSEIKAGETVEMKIKIENKSSGGIYGGSGSEFIISKVGKTESVFFLNNIWQSTTDVAPMEEGDVLKKGESGEFTFQVKAPLFIGNVSEEFTIKNIDGSKVISNTFKIALNINSSEFKIVEILDTETGKLNVRTTPSSVASVVKQVSPGQRFFKVEDAGNGWIKIRLNDGNEGWIAGWYTKAIN